MTKAFQGEHLAQLLVRQFPDARIESSGDAVWIESEVLQEMALFLRDDPSLSFNYLNSISAVDYVEYFEIVYHLTSIGYNHSAVIKTKLYGREAPLTYSVITVWPGADFQEREIWDLMGVFFDGHPNLRRIMLWEGFPGHPHRRDFSDVVKY